MKKKYVDNKFKPANRSLEKQRRISQSYIVELPRPTKIITKKGKFIGTEEEQLEEIDEKVRN